jgi:carboxyl-terminal processing protease
VELKWVDEGRVAWFRVYRFGDKTKNEWDSSVVEILAKKGSKDFKGVVLDLRNNPGGYLLGAVELASEFVKDGVVVQQEGKDNIEKFEALGGGRLYNLPLVILVNQGSASASEILAGALRERLKVKVVGEKTFGKGTVQEAQELSDGAGLHVTIARWLLPSGKNIHGEGLKPDVEVKYEAKEGQPDYDNQLEKAIEIL